MLETIDSPESAGSYPTLEPIIPGLVEIASDMAMTKTTGVDALGTQCSGTRKKQEFQMN